MRARVAWVLAGLTVVLAVADVVVTAQYRPLLSEEAVAEHGFPFVNGAVLGSAVLGAIIISRYERHPIGWLLCLVGVDRRLLAADRGLQHLGGQRRRARAPGASAGSPAGSRPCSAGSSPSAGWP